ncbi:MAG: hypothetical protein KBT89_16045 [Gammaproteobacteria bacterium]|nr:hypothetical protein [Gammaproteobacteria bacterium]
MSDTTDRDDPFEAIGYQRHSKGQVNKPLKANPKSTRQHKEVALKKPGAIPEASPEVAAPQRHIEYKLQMEEALIRVKPTTACHECGGALGSFTERTPAGRTQLFRFCTGCGVVVSEYPRRGK